MLLPVAVSRLLCNFTGVENGNSDSVNILDLGSQKNETTNNLLVVHGMVGRSTR